MTDGDMDSLMKRLHLANLRRTWKDVVLRAETEGWTYHDFLALLVSEEVAQRQQTRIQRFCRRADFPFLKTIDDFDFSYQSAVKLVTMGSYLSPDFVTDGRCLILHGDTGRGKTHLAVAIAYRAIQNGFEALFITAAALIDDLSNASRNGRLVERLAVYTRPHVLVIDEVGYLTYGQDAANVLFHVVNDRHLRRRSMVFTTNKQTDDWGRVLHDPDLAAAIVDRILERGRVISLDGPSGRTRHLQGGANQPLKPARVSGKLRPEFPEPPPGHPAFWCIPLEA
jgi:DNA replication protein DnaC